MQDLFAEAVDAAGELEHRGALGATGTADGGGRMRRGGELAQPRRARAAEADGHPLEAGGPLERARRAVVLGEALDGRVEVAADRDARVADALHQVGDVLEERLLALAPAAVQRARPAEAHQAGQDGG